MIDWIAAGFELSAGWVIGNKNRWGFVLAGACDVLWVVAALKWRMYGLLLVVIPAFVVNTRNFIKWTREKNG